MQRGLLRIVNERGLHARAAARFVALAERFEAEIEVAHHDMTVPGRSIMGLLLLGAGPGCEIELVCRGVDAAAAFEALRALVADGFSEV